MRTQHGTVCDLCQTVMNADQHALSLTSIDGRWVNAWFPVHGEKHYCRECAVDLHVAYADWFQQRQIDLAFTPVGDEGLLSKNENTKGEYHD